MANVQAVFDQLSSSDLQQCFEHLSDAFLICSAVRDSSRQVTDFTVVYANAAAVERSCLAGEEIVGQRLRELFAGPTADLLIKHYAQVLRDDKPWHTDALPCVRANHAPTVATHCDLRAWKLDRCVASIWRDVSGLHTTVQEPLPHQEPGPQAPTTQTQTTQTQTQTDPSAPAADSDSDPGVARPYDKTELLNALIDHIPVLLCIWDPQLQRFRFNRHGSEVLGWTEADGLGGNLMERFYPDAQYRAQVAQYMQSLDSGFRDLRTTARDGSEIDIAWANIRLSDDTMVGIGVDIRERLASERSLRESQARLRLLIDALPVGVAVVDKTGRVLLMNKAGLALHGFSALDEMLEHLSDYEQSFEVLYLDGQPVPPEQWPLAQALRDQYVTSMEVLLRRTDGEGERLVSYSSVPVRVGDEATGELLMLMHDITEHKQAEQALRESEARFRNMADSTPVLIWMSDSEKQGIYFNQTWLKYTGEPLEQQLGAEWLKLVHPDDAAQLEHTCRSAFYRREPFTTEFRLRAADGSYRWMLDAGSPRFAPDGAFAGFIGSCIDIQDRKEAEHALRESEGRLAAELTAMTRLHELVSRLLVCPDLQSSLQEVLSATIEISGADMGNIQRYDEHDNTLRIVAHQGFDQPFLDHFYEVDLSTGSSCGQALLSRRRIIIDDVTSDPDFAPHIDVARAANFKAVQSTPLISRSGELLGMLSTHYSGAFRPSERDLRILDLYARQATDLIERRRAEQALRDGEHQLRLALSAGRMGNWRWDLSNDTVHGDDLYRKLWDLEDEPPAIPLQKVLSRIHPEDRQVVISDQQAAALTAPLDTELRVVHRDGSVRWMRTSAVLFKDGDSRRLVGVNFDITDQKEAEQALRESERRERERAADMQTLIEAVPVMVGVSHDPDCHHVTGNRLACEILRKPHGANLAQRQTDGQPDRPIRVLHPDGREFSQEELPLVRATRWGQPVRDMRLDLLFHDGARRAMYGNAEPLLDSEGAPRGAVSAFLDITELARMQEALAESERQLALVIDSAPVLIAHCDREARFRFVNRLYAQRFGLDPQEVVGKHVSEVLGQEAYAEVAPHIEHVLLGRTVEFEVEMLLPKLGRRYMQARYAPEADSEGNVHGFIAVVTDLTTRREAEKAVQDARDEAQQRATEAEERQRMLTAMMKYIPVGIVMADAPDGNIQMVSRYARELVGRDRDELEYIPAELHPERWRLLHSDGVTPATAEELPLTRAVRHGEFVRDEEFVLERRDGSKVPIMATAAPIQDDQGRITGGVVGWLDITERKQAEAALRDSEERFRNMADTAPAILWKSDADHQFTLLSRGWYEFTGQPEGEGLGLGWLEAVHPDDRDRVARTFLEAAEHRQPFRIDHRVRTADGSDRWVVDIGHPRFDGEGVFLGYVGSVIDIHDRKLAEAAVSESEERFRTMADGMPLLVWMGDAQNNQEFMNDTFCEFFGVSRTEISEQRWHELVHPDDRERYVTSFSRASERHEPFHAEVRVRDGRGRWRWLECWAQPRMTDAGDYCGMIGVSADVTERRQMEEALRQTRDQLEHRVTERTAELRQANQVLNHRNEQLRRLTSQLTLAEQRERQRLAKVLHDHLQQLLVAVQFKLNIVGSRAGQEQQPVLHDIGQLVGEAIDSSRSLAVELAPPILQEAGLIEGLKWLTRSMRERHALSVDLKIEQGLTVDDEKLKLLLFESVRELVFNAVKHAAAQHVVVEMNRPDPQSLRVTVQDDGKGFDPQVVWKASGDADDAGGFGLATIRERLTWLGGRFEVDSAPGSGAKVTLTAPLQTSSRPGRLRAAGAAAAAVSRPPQTPPQRGAATGKGNDQDAAQRMIRVLLVDDHPVVRQGLAMLLSEEQDIEVIGEASDGEQAVEMGSRQHPDVVLMDCSMPKMDGVEATRLLTGCAPGVCVIGLSMYEEADRAQAMLEAGASAYLSKSGNPAALLRTIRMCSA